MLFLCALCLFTDVVREPFETPRIFQPLSNYSQTAEARDCFRRIVNRPGPIRFVHPRCRRYRFKFTYEMRSLGLRVTGVCRQTREVIKLSLSGASWSGKSSHLARIQSMQPTGVTKSRDANIIIAAPARCKSRFKFQFAPHAILGYRIKLQIHTTERLGWEFV